ncbi:hypothetical protein AVEN_260795-1 [Araneus ventricosus]|uniref:Uncharacterized protein n=1 Tax=Araneus ventricosus TaxID=182803 RepID=A0A4Y2FFU6_ARAVE|nr:hypothetical protein AVEN_260795-1 [Araneus ventricosus]
MFVLWKMSNKHVIFDKKRLTDSSCYAEIHHRGQTPSLWFGRFEYTDHPDSAYPAGITAKRAETLEGGASSCLVLVIGSRFKIVRSVPIQPSCGF